MDEFQRDLTDYEEDIKQRALHALRDDIRSGDITTDALFEQDHKLVDAEIIVKAPGVLAGILEASAIFEDGRLDISYSKKDGDNINNNEVIMKLSGSSKEILKRERTALNYLQRMSGIATLSKRFADKYQGKIAFLRKTDPGLLYSEKRAVKMGGCLTHRIGLFDGYLIKDNHIKARAKESNDREKAIRESITSIYKKDSAKLIEIEINALESATVAAETFKELDCKGAVLLDNMSPEEISKGVEKIRSIYNNIIIEASGRIDESNIDSYLKTGVDFVSTSYLLYGSKPLDMSLRVK